MRSGFAPDRDGNRNVDAIAPFVASLVVFHGRLALLSAGDAGAYPFVFQRVSEPVGVIAPVPEQPFHVWQATQQSPCADVVADLPGGDEKIEWASLTVTDGVQLGVHAALRSANQASTPPFFAAMLVAVRWALR